MIRLCTIRRSSNRVILAAIILLGAGDAGAGYPFRNSEDRQIVRDVLRTFGKECALRAAGDGEILNRLETEAANARKSLIVEVQKCYDGSISQVTGVYFLYQKLCNDVSAVNDKTTESTMARQLLDVSKYQSGIRPYQSVLNDCLIAVPDRKGRPFLVPLAGTELDVKLLQRQIEETGVGDPFPATHEPHR